tara:strand:- start:337 stop:1206 length:870 start_codon:yes stop_codon:yes gene_type:complete
MANIFLQILENPHRGISFQGSATATMSGDLKLLFDNSFALWKTKTIHIDININNEKKYPSKIILEKLDVSKWNTFNHGMLKIATTTDSECELNKLEEGGFKIEVYRGRTIIVLFKNINKDDSIKWYVETQENDINFSMNLQTHIDPQEIKQEINAELTNENKKLLQKITQIHQYNHEIKDNLTRKNRSLSEEIEQLQNNENTLKTKILKFTNIIDLLEKRNGTYIDATLESELARSKLRKKVIILSNKLKQERQLKLEKKIKEKKKDENIKTIRKSIKPKMSRCCCYRL